MRTIFAVLSFVGFTVTALAGDGISQSEIKPLLGALAPRWQELKQTYDIQDAGIALLMSERVNPTLAGVRILPFEFRAKPKGTNGPDTLTIEITGENVFLDSHGKEVDMTKATRCKVKPEEISVHPR